MTLYLSGMLNSSLRLIDPAVLERKDIKTENKEEIEGKESDHVSMTYLSD